MKFESFKSKSLYISIVAAFAGCLLFTTETSQAQAPASSAGSAATTANVSSPPLKPAAAVSQSPASATAAMPNKNTKPGPLPLAGITQAEAPAGCGCSFYQPTNLRDNGPLQLRMNTDKKAVIKPGGVLTPMTVVEEQLVRRNPKAKTVSAQDKLLIKFRGVNSDTTASLVATAERNCEKSAVNADQCKSVTYQSLLTLAVQGATRSYPLWGTCSCPAAPN